MDRLTTRTITVVLAAFATLLGVPTLVLASTSGGAGTVTPVYTDSLQSGMQNWSWADTVEGDNLTVTFDEFEALFLSTPEPITLGSDTNSLVFTVDATPASSVQLEVLVFEQDWQVNDKFSVETNTQTAVEFELELGSTSTVRALWWRNVSSDTVGPVVFDDIKLVGSDQVDETVPADTTPDSGVVPEIEPPEQTPPVESTPETPAAEPTPDGFALFETFDGAPDGPSQSLLPDNFDFALTHRTHPGDSVGPFDPFPGDHGDDCGGPPTPTAAFPSHQISTSHDSNGTNPDEAFYICRDHMMTALGDVAGYSVNAYWPQQEFDFTEGGKLTLDVNIDEKGPRLWWEVMIVPADKLRIGAAEEIWPIDETYPGERIVFEFRENKRRMHTATGSGSQGRTADVFVEESTFAQRHPDHPANTDRRPRLTHEFRFDPDANMIWWDIEHEDGSFDQMTYTLSEDMPVTKGLVVVTQHAYTPQKANNVDNYTFHWDNFGFTGPVTGTYESYEADSAVYLEANGDRPIGDSETVTIDIPSVPADPKMFGQLHAPAKGQVLLSVNGSEPFEVHADEYPKDNCTSEGWASFTTDIDPALLRAGSNDFEWIVGPRPACSDGYPWDGFSVKSLEIQAR